MMAWGTNAPVSTKKPDRMNTSQLENPCTAIREANIPKLPRQDFSVSSSYLLLMSSPQNSSFQGEDNKINRKEEINNLIGEIEEEKEHTIDRKQKQIKVIFEPGRELKPKHHRTNEYYKIPENFGMKSFRMGYSTGTGHPKLSVPLNLCYKGKSLDVDAVVDTGSAFNLLIPKSVQSYLQIKLSPEPEPVALANGETSYVYPFADCVTLRYVMEEMGKDFQRTGKFYEEKTVLMANCAVDEDYEVIAGLVFLENLKLDLVLNHSSGKFLLAQRNPRNLKRL